MTVLSPQQLRTLHTLFGLYSRRSLDVSRGDARTARLAWASQNAGHPIGSFSELHADEAGRLIEALKLALGQEVKPPRRRPRDRQTAHLYGTAGRRGDQSQEIRLVDAETLRLVDELLARLDWSRERLEAFLQSRKSPVRSGVIRTLGEANRLIWSLKAMLHRAA